jgi:hypothetical protein
MSSSPAVPPSCSHRLSANFFSTEPQANADTAAVLGNQNHVAIFQRLANLLLLVRAWPAESRFEVPNDLEVHTCRVRQLDVSPFE